MVCYWLSFHCVDALTHLSAIIVSMGAITIVNGLIIALGVEITLHFLSFLPLLCVPLVLRNSKASLMSPSPQTLNLIFVIVTSALHIFFITQREHVSFRGAIMKGVGSAVVFCLAVAVIWPVAALLTYHLRVREFAPFFSILDFIGLGLMKC
jgi:hypothetical protein